MYGRVFDAFLDLTFSVIHFCRYVASRQSSGMIVSGESCKFALRMRDGRKGGEKIGPDERGRRTGSRGNKSGGAYICTVDVERADERRWYLLHIGALPSGVFSRACVCVCVCKCVLVLD